ncbi:DUF6973 domain-containing protein [Aquimarina spongiae]|uniref:DUF6973 domain-containing protein n=1 Tax=Aquimarina spongiae TaxID=570521 RepID=A0A1M6F0D6_9FLAO|nr:hypothetical protein [Aquimarina spongiae]SHI91089.1 hypothetical protein SAMN04488508_10422 [Aquimarina spongiae]
MNLIAVIRRLSLKEILSLIVLLVQYPLYIFPTLRATKQTLNICNIEYKDSHHLHGKGNAFRHALWNVLLALYTFRIHKNVQKSIKWAERITDLHEELAPNNSLEKAMDLHNNAVGRAFFGGLKNHTLNEIVVEVKQRAECGIVIRTILDIEQYKKDLVYLAEEN